MARFGASYPCFKPDDAKNGVVLGKLVSANMTPNMASGELFGDDALAEQVSEFSSAAIAMETDSMTDDNASIVYGCKVNDKEVVYNKDDTPPQGRLGYYQTLMRKGKKYYRGYRYPRVRAALGNDNAQTKSNNITFSTEQTNFTVFADDEGNWRFTETFDTAAAAKEWIDEYCAISGEAAGGVPGAG